MHFPAMPQIPKTFNAVNLDFERALDVELQSIRDKIKERLQDTEKERQQAFSLIEYQVRETYQGN
jgi:hypothetical protein